MDKLLINVARDYESEEGLESTELFQGRDDLDISTVSVSAGDNRTEFVFNKTAKRWISMPVAEPNSDDANTWFGANNLGFKLIQAPFLDADSMYYTVLDNGTDGNDWGVVRLEQLEPGRGFLIWFQVFECEDEDYADRPFGFWLDNRWRVKFTGSKESPGVCVVSKHYPTGQSILPGEGATVAVAPILDKPLRGSQGHQIWVQPLGPDEWMICNLHDQEKCIVAVDSEPVEIDPDERRADGEDYTDGRVKTPFAEAIQFFGYSRAEFCFRYCKYPAAPYIKPKALRDLGYESTQDVTTDVKFYRPLEDERYDCTLTVYEDAAQTTEWEADINGQSEYSWKLLGTMPEDAGTGYAKRALVVSRATMNWPKVMADDGLTSIDLFNSSSPIQVLSLEEYRDENDLNSTLSVTLRGKASEIYDYIRPNDRWQWQIETLPGPTYVTRFDGLLDACEQRTYATADDVAMLEFDCVLHTRWRQARYALYRGGIPLDGLKRSEAYTALFKQLPLDTSTELSIATLADDDPLPSGRAGEDPAFEPEIGTPLIDVISELRDGFGPDDRLTWVELVGGPGMYIDQPATTSSYTFYKTQAAADAALKPTQSIGSATVGGALAQWVEDIDFYNEIWVVGRGKKASENGETVYYPIWAYYGQPKSWKDASFPQYINIRKPLIVYAPELQTEADVMQKCVNLANKFAFFNRRYVFTSGFVPGLFPGSTITIDDGLDPFGTGVVTAKVRSMRTRVTNLNVVSSRMRYESVYEVSKR